jgi:hypothetical protein
MPRSGQPFAVRPRWPILTRYAGPHGVLFDLPRVVAEAPALLKARGVNDRETIEAGDFFKTVSAGGDAYVLSHIVHDWDGTSVSRSLDISARL